MASFRLDGRLRGRIDPDDVLQESYLAAAKRLSHFGEEAAFSPFVWFRMILAQTLVDIHRRHLGAQKRDARRDVAIQGSRFSQSTSASMAIQLVGDLTSPSQAAARAETLSAIQESVDKMAPMDREILALRHFEELTNSEVAAVLGIQEKAASIRYIRALRRLKTILSDVPGFVEAVQNA